MRARFSRENSNLEEVLNGCVLDFALLFQECV